MEIGYRSFLSGLFLLSVGAALGVPAHPGERIVVNPDGTVVTLRLLGDEYGHVTVDEKGRMMTLDADGNWRVSALDAGMELRRLRSVKRGAAWHGRAAHASAMHSNDVNRSSFPRSGEVRALVVLVDFPDVNFVTPDIMREVDEMLNLPGFDRREHIGSAADYFRAQSMGRFSPHFDVYGPVRADKPATWYGENDENGDDMRAKDLAMEICRKLDAEIDFTQYDLDDDGQIDNLYFFYAGYGENFAGNKAAWIWPHAAHLDEYGIAASERTYDGKVLNSYGCCAELYGSTGADVASIGTFCHEFGHILGLPDTYDVNYAEDGSGNHPDKWDIMASGSYLPATRNCGAVPAGYTGVERWLLGWDEPVEINAPQSVELPALQSSGKSLRISTGHPDEFFVLENRQQSGYDRFIPSHGLLVWHVDRRPEANIRVTIAGESMDISCADAWTLDYNAVNSNASHQCLEIEKASGNDGSKSSLDTPFPGRQMRTSFSDETSPSMRSWNGIPTGKPVTGITEQTGVVRFDFMGGGEQPSLQGLEVAGVTDSSMSVRWEDHSLAEHGYEVMLYGVTHRMEQDAETINETFKSLPEGWTLAGDASYSGEKITLGGSKASKLTTGALDLSEGATLTVSASQSGATACVLKIYAGDDVVEEYIPTATASDYVVEITPTEATTLSFAVDRRKSVCLERVVLTQDVERVDMELLAREDETGVEHLFDGLTKGQEYACRVGVKGFAAEPSSPVFATVGVSAGLDESFASDCGSVRYYTLQGIEVREPQLGHFYIEVHGGTARKRIWK